MFLLRLGAYFGVSSACADIITNSFLPYFGKFSLSNTMGSNFIAHTSCINSLFRPSLQRTARQTKAAFNAYAQAGAVAEEVFSAIRTVHAFDGKEKEIERYNEKIANAAKASQTRELYSALLSGLQWTLFCLLNALGTWYGMQLLVKQMHWDPSDIVYTPKTMFIVSFPFQILWGFVG